MQPPYIDYISEQSKAEYQYEYSAAGELDRSSRGRAYYGVEPERQSRDSNRDLNIGRGPKAESNIHSRDLSRDQIPTSETGYT